MANLASIAFVGCFPWAEPSDRQSVKNSTELSRGCVILPYTESDVFCDECKDPLPLIARWTDRDRKSWCKYELPTGDFQQSHSFIFQSEGVGGRPFRQEVPLGPGVLRSFLDEQLEDEEEAENLPQSIRRYSKIRDLIDTHIEFLNDLCDQIRPNRYYWEGNCGGIAARSVRRVASCWMNANEHGNARLALIVKLAREIAQILGLVCDGPRVVLRRSREFQSIAKIQEIDPSCLRWLARQPGRDVYERAGSRQQLLGVVRREDSDTLENRMVKDLLHRARIECGNYISLNRDFSNHDRVRVVSNFRRHLIKWEKHSEIAHAKRLTGPVHPNYVLLHEPRYKKLWDAYQLLLSQQKQKDDIWRWRARTFSESCEFGLLGLLRQQARRSLFDKSDVLIHLEAITGKFVSTDTQFGPTGHSVLPTASELVLCRGVHAYQCPFIAREFYSLAADFFLVARMSPTVSPVLPVWCLIETSEEKLIEGVQLLEQKLRDIPRSDSIRPLILLYDEPGLERVFFDGRGRVISLEFPIQKSIKKVAASVLSNLGAL